MIRLSFRFSMMLGCLLSLSVLAYAGTLPSEEQSEQQATARPHQQTSEDLVIQAKKEFGVGRYNGLIVSALMETRVTSSTQYLRGDPLVSFLPPFTPEEQTNIRKRLETALQEELSKK